MNPQFRATLRLAYDSSRSNPSAAGAECPNRARLIVGALTEIERKHIKNCLWCQKALETANVGASRKRCKRRSVMLPVFALAVLVCLCLYPTALGLWKKPQAHPLPATGSSSSAEVEAPTVYILGEVFGGRSGAAEAIQIVDQGRKELGGLWTSAAALTSWANDEVELSKAIGDPCYFSMLVKARLEMAHGFGPDLTKALAESSRQVHRVKNIGVKQELINLHWNQADLKACAASVQEAKHQKLMRRRARERRQNGGPNIIQGDSQEGIHEQSKSDLAVGSGGIRHRHHASQQPTP